MLERETLLKRVLPIAAVLIAIPTFIFWGPKDSPRQAPIRPFDLEVVAPVQKAGSDIKSAVFVYKWGKQLMEMASESFRESVVKERFGELALDPAKLRVEEATHIRVYFLGEATKKKSSLGVNFNGIGAEKGKPMLLFPNQNSVGALYDNTEALQARRWELTFYLFFMRNKISDDPEEYVLPGDFVDLGKVEAGTELDFFLIADGANYGREVFTTRPEANPDKLPHVVALAVEDSPFLILSFEDEVGGGDGDYSDCVFVVTMSQYNIKALMGYIDPWRRAKQIAKMVAFLVIFVGGPIGAFLARLWIRRKRARAAIARAKELLAQGQVDKAMALIGKGKTTYREKRLLQQFKTFEFKALQDTNDAESLAILFDESHDDFKEREGASLLAARAQLACERNNAFGELRELWRGREKARRQWTELDADLLIAEGHAGQLEERLAKVPLDAAPNAGLAARLALAMAEHAPEEGCALAARAAAMAPQDAAIHAVQGQILDGVGAAEKAHAAYQNALRLAPHDPIILDRAAEFYRRHGKLNQALQIWSKGLARPSLQTIWLKYLFWRRVAVSAPLPQDHLSPPKGNLLPVIEVLGSLPDGVFWTDDATDRLEARPGLLDRQEVLWLRLLEALRSNKEDEALALLNLNRFGERSWSPALEAAMLRLLTYRRAGFMDPSALGLASGRGSDDQHPFLVGLDKWAHGEYAEPPADLLKIVQSREAFAHACLAAGWGLAGKILGSRQ
jgi:tetratricopeptide (TPR) repeat protein